MRYKFLGQTGLKVSRLGFGGTAFSGFYSRDKKNNFEAIHRALELGINYFDVAPWYTNSQAIFGSVLSQYDRDKYYIATKVGRYQEKGMFDFSKEKIIKSIHESLKDLRVDYVDVIQIHDPEFATSTNVLLDETLPTLQKMKEEGLVKHIGITGYPLHLIVELIKKSPILIETALSYSRATLQDSSLIYFSDYFENLGLINGSINALSLLTPAGPAIWHPTDWRTKNICKKVLELCCQQGVSLPRLSMHYTAQFNCITTSLISTTDVSLLERNIEHYFQPLTVHEQDVLTKIEKILQPIKNCHWENNEVMKYWKKKNSL